MAAAAGAAGGLANSPAFGVWFKEVGQTTVLLGAGPGARAPLLSAACSPGWRRPGWALPADGTDARPQCGQRRGQPGDCQQREGWVWGRLFTVPHFRSHTEGTPRRAPTLIPLPAGTGFAGLWGGRGAAGGSPRAPQAVEGTPSLAHGISSCAVTDI